MTCLELFIAASSLTAVRAKTKIVTATGVATPLAHDRVLAVHRSLTCAVVQVPWCGGSAVPCLLCVLMLLGGFDDGFGLPADGGADGRSLGL
ncbi:hypothetical protein Dimus_006360 [Dionaea muscipula]